MKDIAQVLAILILLLFTVPTFGYGAIRGAIVLSIPSEMLEGGGVYNGTVTLTAPLNTGEQLLVYLQTSEAGRLNLPTSVTIQAGTMSTSFNMEVNENSIDDGDVVATVTASATNWLSAQETTFIRNDDHPEISVTGNGHEIPSGDTSPATIDNTDFGRARVPGSPMTHVFNIKNMNGPALLLTGDPIIQLSGADSDKFQITTPPSVTTIDSGSSVDFAISFLYSQIGSYSVQVLIANSDPDENPYTFTISATAIASFPWELFLQAIIKRENDE